MICLAASTIKKTSQLRFSPHVATRSLYLLVTFSQPVFDIADTRKGRPDGSERLGIVLADPW